MKLPTFDKPSEEIKQRLDIVEVIQEYIPLKQAGANFRALCPFHSEKTPSFFVSREKQIWHCFGCDEGGDVFSFVMKMEGIEFVDALKLLAKKAGVILKKQDPVMQNKRTRLLEILDLAAKFYHQSLLVSHSGKIARDYLKKRKIENTICDEFKLGFAPNSWDALSRFLKKKGYKDDEIIESGLVVKKEIYAQKGLSYYDRFRNRLMFPICDVYGNVIGFGGRILENPKVQKEKLELSAKYINTPQTLVYDKSRVLYGLDKAKTEIRKKKKVIIVEGYTDVISSYQAGIKNVVATSGTALTQNQIELIKRYSENIVLAFDMDLAGDAAAKRGIDLALAAGLSVRIALLPDALDPDECIRKNLKLWISALEHAQTIMDYYFKSAFSGVDLTRIEDKKKVVACLLPVIRKIPDKIEQAHYLQKLAQKLAIDEKILAEALARQKDLKVRFRKTKKGFVFIKNKVVHNLTEKRIIAIALKNPQFLDYLRKNLTPHYFSDSLRPLYIKIMDHYNKNKDFKFTDFEKRLEKTDSKLAQKAKELCLYLEKDFFETKSSQSELQKELKAIVVRLKKDFLQKRLREIELEMRKVEQSCEKEKIFRLAKKFNKVSEELAALSI